MNALRTPKITGIAWLVVRLYLGYEWFMGGFEKVVGPGSERWIGDQAGASVAGFLNGAIAKSALAEGFDPIKTPHPAVQEWYAILARDVFLPNAALFSYLIAFGELLVGIALIVGLFTRFSAFMGVVMALALFLAGAVSTLPQLLTIGLVITLVGTNAGYYGLDSVARPIEQLLARRTRERFFHAPQPA
ncbi:MAG TPA: DoxX family membrane protein [Herpetosiphonaceae bacterium]